MKMFQYRGEHPNFGDELNSWLWPKLLPEFFDENPETLFVGIGSTIGDAAQYSGKKIVFGAGFVPHYHEEPNLAGSDWQVYFVRGPRTAKRLGLAESSVISDAGILVRDLVDFKQRTPEHIAFIPHWQSLGHGNWEAACRKAGITLIDPRKPVEEVLDLLLRSKLVIAEAMHGAIVADALRVPWVPVVPLNPAHREKWYDWAESMGIVLKPQRLFPSSLAEMTVAALCASKATGAHPDNQDSWKGGSLFSCVKRLIAASPLRPLVNACLSRLAALRLKKLARIAGSLSSDAAMESAIQRMHEKIAQLKRDYARG